jgi:hypothetical protein
MSQASHEVDVYLEAGAKRTFAGALDWPGWSRSGKDEASALQALVDYAPRYAQVLRSGKFGFEAPTAVSSLATVERLKGNATTDFGAPGMIPAGDSRPVDEVELGRLQGLLQASWRALDEAAAMARGRALRLGPRGGGRDLEEILNHVVEAERAYISRLGGQPGPGTEKDLGERAAQTRQAALQALAAAVHGELPARGPRGGQHWPARYFVRRAAWHVLDHAWEIEDRVG